MKHNIVNISVVLSGLVAMLLAMSWPADATTVYSLINLGVVSGSVSPNISIAYDINNSGEIIGTGSRRPRLSFRTAPNSPINPATDELGNLGGNSIIFLGTDTVASGINESGQVAGVSAINNSDQRHAFRTAANSPINPAKDDLGTLGGATSAAYGINKSGQVVGSSITDSGQTHAFRTAANSPINPAKDDLGTLGGATSAAYGINKSGQVVGSSITDSEQTHAFRTAANSPINPATDDLGTLGGATSVAYGINKSGQVVGSSITDSGQTHAFRTAANSPINPATDDLGTLGGTSSVAYGVNKSGQVVGSSTTDSGQTHAFLYDVSGDLIDLNSLISPDSGSDFLELTTARAVNNLGQIVGVGSARLANGGPEERAFLATPITQSSSKKILNISAFGAVLGTGLAFKRKQKKQKSRVNYFPWN